MKDTPLDTIGDDPVEARIVAWVLGEASAFEAAELERLCGEDPALEAFRQRMLSLHGLLTEVVAPASDDSWKLPAGKREALEEILGPPQPAISESAKERQIRRSGRRALWAIAACLVVSLIIAKFIGPIGPSSPIRTAESTISYSPNPSPEAELAALNKAIRDQEDKVEEQRKVLSTIVRTKGIIYKGQDSFYDQRLKNVELRKDHTREDAIKRGLDAQDYVDAKRGFESDQELLQAMKLKQIELSVRQSALSADLASANSDSSGFSLAENQSSLRERSPASPVTRPLRARSTPPPAAPAQPAADLEPLAAMDSAPAEPRAEMAGVISNLTSEAYGLHSGDQAVNRNNIDAILDNPNRVAGMDRDAIAMNEPETAELLSQVDQAWELSLPADSAPSAPSAGVAAVEQKPAALGRAFSSSREAAGELEEQAASLRRQLEEPALADSNKQALFRDWQETQKKRAEMEKAKAATLEPSEETTAAAEPYSTFSLNINDASFQIAKTALEKGERPEPAAIKTEQFYNAVDYGDPSPASNEPVTAFIEQSAHPVIPGRNLVRVSLKTAAAGRGASQPLRLTLLVDQSGSMVREDRRAAMATALRQLAPLLTAEDRIHVVGFSRTPRLLAEGLTGDQAGKLPDLIHQTASEGGTNLEEALKLGEQLAARNPTPGAQNRIVLFTDGAANLGNADPERLATRIKALRQQGIAFDIAGIGADGLNDRLLGELARHGNGRYHVVDETSDSFARQLAGAFRPAAENVKVQVHFNPQRVGSYKLIGFEKDRLKTEDFRNDTVDAAELAAEEAGVAIYQVETLPEGSGEIGELSVRFRDTAKGEMVERKWTMPYESAALPFDRATQPMQLAGLSMLAAEKLKGGPLADAIDFKTLAETTAEVKRFYNGSPRVADMLQVIEMLK